MPKYLFDGVFDISIEIPLSIEADDYDDAWEAAADALDDAVFDLNLNVDGTPVEWRLVASPYPIHLRPED